MFKIETASGEKFLVQLVGAKSYRIGNMKVTRGGTLTVSRETRDYLVRETGGQFIDYDPTPTVEVEEVLPPQFGEYRGPRLNMADFDPKTNPVLTQAEAAMLAEQGVHSDQNGKAVSATRTGPQTGTPVPQAGQVPVTRKGHGRPSNASHMAAESERGDMTAADLKGTAKEGGAKAGGKFRVLNPEGGTPGETSTVDSAPEGVLEIN